MSRWHSSSLGSRVRSEDAVERPLVVLASERMDADPGWRPLASGELLHITDTLRASTRLILEHPPARPLTHRAAQSDGTGLAGARGDALNSPPPDPPPPS